MKNPGKKREGIFFNTINRKQALPGVIVNAGILLGSIKSNIYFTGLNGRQGFFFLLLFFEFVFKLTTAFACRSFYVFFNTQIRGNIILVNFKRQENQQFRKLKAKY